MSDLTPRQHQVLTALRGLDDNAGSLSELAARLGVHYVTLRQHLQALERKGHLTIRSNGRGRPPTINLLRQPAAGIPIVGQIRAGRLEEALQEPEGYLDLPSTKNTFALRVSGDSMADLIQDGDLVLLRRDTHWSNGAICAVRVDDDTTLKYLTRDGPNVILTPHNPAYPTTTHPASQVQIDGVYQGLLRGAAARTLHRQ